MGWQIARRASAVTALQNVYVLSSRSSGEFILDAAPHKHTEQGETRGAPQDTARLPGAGLVPSKATSSALPESPL